MTEEFNWREAFTMMSRNPLLMNALVQPLLKSRSDLMARTGMTFGGDRKHYQVFGWPTSLTYEYFQHLYERGGIAKRIVQAYPQACWRTPPGIKEEERAKKDSQEDTRFEADWKQFADKRRVFHYLARVNTLARLGTFALLFIGYNDSQDLGGLSQPVGTLRGAAPEQRVLYLQPYSEADVQVDEWEDDPKNERYAQPRLYTIQIKAPSGIKSPNAPQASAQVHWTRVLHVAEDMLENDLQGYPALEPIFNYLVDLEKVHGAAAEAFFQQTPPGLVFSSDPASMIDPTSFTDSDAQDRIDEFIHQYKRWLAVSGMKVDAIVPQLGDPEKIKEALLELISGTTGIPKRILVGSERGELSSEQDETNWNKRVEEYQNNWAEPFLLRPFMDEMIAKGVLAGPSSEGYSVEWQEQRALSEQVMADISAKKTEALVKYADSAGAHELVPEDIFLEETLGFSQETIDRIKDTRQELWDKELEDSLNPPEPMAPVAVSPPLSAKGPAPAGQPPAAVKRTRTAPVVQVKEQ